MQVSSRHFPHPVLSYFSDDISGTFLTEIKHNALKSSKDHFCFDASCLLDNEDILELIRTQKAKYAFHLECPNTRTRKIFTSFDASFNIEVPSDELDGKVQVCSFVLAAQDISDYKNKHFHSDYEDAAFRIMKGDILAVAPDTPITVENNSDPLKKVHSIFTVGLNKNKDAPPFDLDANGDKIVIKLSKDNLALYKAQTGDHGLQTVRLSLTVFPALITILEMMKSEDDQYVDNRWHRVLTQKLNRLEIDIKNPSDSTLVIAQKLMGSDPLNSSLNALAAIYDTEEE